jgi:DNA/RNA-binding domain of Phe-tRNA-synthetase-like protein
MIELSAEWRAAYPGAVVGFLSIRGACGTSQETARNGALDELRERIEADLRVRFSAGGKDALRAHPVMAAYESYYRKYRKTYHVALQLDSVIWKGRRISAANPLVLAMFMAELSNMLLTAGHDLGRIAAPVRVGLASGRESYATLGGAIRQTTEGDMMMGDAQGIISSILIGPDGRTAISALTTDVLFAVYAPSGIGAERVRAHLQDIQRFVSVSCPDAAVESLECYSAD